MYLSVYDYFRPISYNTNFNTVVMNYYNQQLWNSWPNMIFGNNIWNQSYNNQYIYNSWNPFMQNVYSKNFNIGSLFNFTGNNNIYRQPQTIYQNSIWSNNKQTQYVQNRTPDMQKPTSTSTLPKTPEDNTTQKQDISSGYIRSSFAKNAEKYLGYNEADNSYRKFSNSTEWCADFVSYIVKESYEEKGLKPPTGFGSASVAKLRDWGIENNKYLNLTDKKDKAQTIKEQVNVGDILILKENNASHTGIVTKINPDGSFETIEGNRNDKVASGKYFADDNEISGFVQLA